ncbi:MAG: hypothetical protein R3F14_44850, partial [Polyangiaceae bacterium]
MTTKSASLILASFVAAFATAGLSLSTTGCDGGGGSGGAGGGGGGDSSCFDYSSFDGTAPAVGFKADVLPLFQRSCGVSTSCHGDINMPNENRPYLGPNKDATATDAEIDAIFAAIVDVGSFYEPGMSIVKSGDPENSFMMYKLDGTLECAALTCA